MIVLNQSPETGFWSLDLGIFRGPSSPLACRCCTSCSFPSVGIRQIMKDQVQTTSRIQTAKKKINPHTHTEVYVYTDVHTYIPMLAKEPHLEKHCLWFVRCGYTILRSRSTFFVDMEVNQSLIFAHWPVASQDFCFQFYLG